MAGIEHKGEYPADWKEIATGVKDEADWCCIRCGHDHDPAAGYCLTVHHFDGDKSNCAWHNLMALCQRCHLTIQAKVNPDQDYMFELSDWMKPYVAGRRAAKAGKELTRPTITKKLEHYLSL